MLPNGLKAYQGVLGVDGRPQPFDPLRDKVAELLISMHKDFIVVKLRPCCQNCKRYITGAPGLEVKYRCKECAKQDAPPLCQVGGSGSGGGGSSSKKAGGGGNLLPSAATGLIGGLGGGVSGGGMGGDVTSTISGSGNSSASSGEKVKVTYDLCLDCYERERKARQAGRPGQLNHEHDIRHFIPISVELAPGLHRTPPPGMVVATTSAAGAGVAAPPLALADAPSSSSGGSASSSGFAPIAPAPTSSSSSAAAAAPVAEAANSSSNNSGNNNSNNSSSSSSSGPAASAASASGSAGTASPEGGARPTSTSTTCSDGGGGGGMGGGGSGAPARPRKSRFSDANPSTSSSSSSSSSAAPGGGSSPATVPAADAAAATTAPSAISAPSSTGSAAASAGADTPLPTTASTSDGRPLPPSLIASTVASGVQEAEARLASGNAEGGVVLASEPGAPHSELAGRPSNREAAAAVAGSGGGDVATPSAGSASDVKPDSTDVKPDSTDVKPDSTDVKHAVAAAAGGGRDQQPQQLAGATSAAAAAPAYGAAIVPTVATITATTPAAGAGAGAGGPYSPDGYLVDPDPTMDSPFFHTRQAFLNLCQGNHYQFDQLRRAKHSSMMILWHMHHPLAPSFVHACNNCAAAIISGHRWSCSVCDEFDLCKDCHEKVGGSHEHKLTQLPVCGVEGTEAAAAAAQAHQAATGLIPRELSLLLHCSSCAGCPSNTCARFKMMITHVEQCGRRAEGGCDTCRRMLTVLALHARSCRLQGSACPVRQCAELKERMRRSGSSQQAMDARRRAAQTAKATSGREGVAQDPNDAATTTAAAAGAAGVGAGGAALTPSSSSSADSGSATAVVAPSASPSSSSSVGAAPSADAAYAMKGGKGPRSQPALGDLPSAGGVAGSGTAGSAGSGGSSGGGSGNRLMNMTHEEAVAQLAKVNDSVRAMVATYPFCEGQWGTFIAQQKATYVTGYCAHVTAEAAKKGAPPPSGMPSDFGALPLQWQVHCLYRSYQLFMQRINAMYQTRLHQLRPIIPGGEQGQGGGAAGGLQEGSATGSSSPAAQDPAEGGALLPGAPSGESPTGDASGSTIL